MKGFKLIVQFFYTKVSVYILPIIFFSVLVLPMLNDLFGFAKYERTNENRTFRDSISIDINHLDTFPEEYESFLNDNFSFRTPLLNAFNKIRYKWYKVSPHPNQMLIGQNGFFFLSREEIEMYEGKHNFTDEMLDKFLNEWLMRRDHFDSLGIKHYLVMAPIKHHIYPEYLPFNVNHKNPIQITDQIINHLKDSLPDLIIDPRPDLIAAKEKERIYYKLDNHWNSRAGEIVSEKILNRIKVDFPDKKVPGIPEFTWRDSSYAGGFFYRLIGDEKLRENDRFPDLTNPQAVYGEEYKFPPIVGFPCPNEHEIRYVNNSEDVELKLLFVRDSYGRALMPFMKENFKESVFIFDSWRYRLNEPILEEMKPDVVVYVILESNYHKVYRKLKD